MFKLSVIICAHQPHEGRLTRTLQGLREQTLPQADWEFLLIDNASRDPLSGRVDLSWHANARVIREDRLGLTHGRLRGISEARGQGLVLVDDDNVLAPDYLQIALETFNTRPEIGVFGGKSIPEYESPVPDWFEVIHGPLATADHGDQMLLARWSPDEVRHYPEFAPVGAGMCLHKDLAEHWAQQVRKNPLRQALGRSGKSLASGEDNDLIMTVLAAGRMVAYLPTLSLLHLIPSGRLEAEYHARLLEASSRTWVLTLGLHGIQPWAPIARGTLGLRKLKAAIKLKPWSGVVPRLRWKAACGQLAGRADLGEMLKSVRLEKSVQSAGEGS